MKKCLLNTFNTLTTSLSNEREIREQAEVNSVKFKERTFTARFFSLLTFFIGFGIEKAYFSPLFSNALSGARFINFLSKAAENFPFGCILHLTPDSHIIPVGEE